jgi:hypothetical protein
MSSPKSVPAEPAPTAPAFHVFFPMCAVCGDLLSIFHPLKPNNERENMPCTRTPSWIALRDGTARLRYS